MTDQNQTYQNGRVSINTNHDVQRKSANRKMVRNYALKTNRTSYSDTAVYAVMKFVTDDHSLHEAEKKLGINDRRLSPYLNANQAKRNFAVGYSMSGKFSLQTWKKL